MKNSFFLSTKKTFLVYFWIKVCSVSVVAIIPCTTRHCKSPVLFSMGGLYKVLQLPFGETSVPKTSCHFESLWFSIDLRCNTFTHSMYKVFLLVSLNNSSWGVLKVSRLPSTSSHAPNAAEILISGKAEICSSSKRLSEEKNNSVEKGL